MPNPVWVLVVIGWTGGMVAAVNGEFLLGIAGIIGATFAGAVSMIQVIQSGRRRDAEEAEDRVADAKMIADAVAAALQGRSNDGA